MAIEPVVFEETRKGLPRRGRTEMGRQPLGVKGRVGQHRADDFAHQKIEVGVLEGEAEVWIEDERRRVTAGQSVVVPAGRKHGFHNSGTGLLRVQAILASPVFEAAYDDKRETPRRWLPGATG